MLFRTLVVFACMVIVATPAAGCVSAARNDGTTPHIMSRSARRKLGTVVAGAAAVTLVSAAVTKWEGEESGDWCFGYDYGAPDPCL